MNVDGIRKPAWFAYKYLHALRGAEIPVADRQVLAATERGSVAALIWDWTQPKQDVSDRPFFTRVHPAILARPARFTFNHLRPGRYTLTIRRTGFRHNDPQTAYLEMGSPVKLTAGQVASLQRLTRDVPEVRRAVAIPATGTYAIQIPMRTNDVVLLQLEQRQR